MREGAVVESKVGSKQVAKQWGSSSRTFLQVITWDQENLQRISLLVGALRFSAGEKLFLSTYAQMIEKLRGKKDIIIDARQFCLSTSSGKCCCYDASIEFSAVYPIECIIWMHRKVFCSRRWSVYGDSVTAEDNDMASNCYFFITYRSNAIIA